jgi:hypothetical protein
MTTPPQEVRRKICKVCGKLKAEVEMAPSRIYKGKLYYQRRCRKCKYAVSDKEWRKENREKYKAAVRSGVKRYRKRYPKRHNARLRVRSWVAKGKMAHLACQKCGNFLSEMHHPDYNFPLDIWWLCRQHHKMADKGELVLYV